MANEYDIQSAQLQRRRGLLNALTQQAFQQPQGQMVSGHYVAPGLLQTLAGPLTALAAGYGQEKVDQQEKDVANARAQALAQSLNALRQGQMNGANQADTTNQLLSSQFPELQKVGQAAALEQLKPETYSTPVAIQGPNGPVLAQFGNKNSFRPTTAQPYQAPSYGGVETVKDPTTGELIPITLEKNTGLPKVLEGYGAYVRPPAQTNINNNMPTQETARAKALGQSEGKMIDTARTQGIVAQRNFNLATRLEGLDASGMFTGPTAKPAVLFNQLASGLGVTLPPDVAKRVQNTENYNVAIGTELKDMILNSSAGKGFTDTDRDFVEKSFPTLMLTPEGRKQAISFMKDASIRALDEARSTEQAISNGTFSGLDLTGGKIDQYRQGQTQQQPQPQAIPKAGEVIQGYQFMGGDPSNPSSWRKQ